MEEACVVCDFLFPADQQSPGAVEPGVRALDFPPSGFAMTGFRFRALGRNVRYVMTAADFALDRLTGVSFIQAEMLWLALRGLWTLHWNVVVRGRHQFLIVHIGAIHRGRQRHATTIDQHRTLDAELAAIGRVFPGFFPHPAAIWSSPRPCSAISSRSLSARRIPAAPGGMQSFARLDLSTSCR